MYIIKFGVQTVFFAALGVVNLACSVFGLRTEETPPYRVIRVEDNFEIREYAPTLVARTSRSGTMKETQNKSFRVLANYIFGGNEARESISMTAPVLQQVSGESIAMTAPVMQQSQGGASVMEFVLPSKYTLASAPKPKDPRVEIVEKPGEIVASVRFTWWYNDERIQRRTSELLSWLERTGGYEPTGGARLAAYDPPFTIPFLRRNEVHLPLRPKP
jgi:hypothetical protein